MKGFKKNISKRIKHSDMFGSAPKIYYKGNHQHHKTLCGGILTQIVKFSLYALIIFKFKTMILKENNTITSYRSTYDVNNHTGINFNETSMNVFHVLVKEAENYGPAYIEKSSRYIDMFFVQKHTNWNLP